MRSICAPPSACHEIESTLTYPVEKTDMFKWEKRKISGKGLNTCFRFTTICGLLGFSFQIISRGWIRPASLHMHRTDFLRASLQSVQKMVFLRFTPNVGPCLRKLLDKRFEKVGKIVDNNRKRVKSIISYDINHIIDMTHMIHSQRGAQRHCI